MFLRLAVATAILSTLVACGTVTRDRITTVDRPVVQPCVAGQRPAAPVALNRKIPPAEWQQRDVRQKAAAVGAQGLERQTYGEQLDAATGACP